MNFRGFFYSKKKWNKLIPNEYSGFSIGFISFCWNRLKTNLNGINWKKYALNFILKTLLNFKNKCYLFSSYKNICNCPVTCKFCQFWECKRRKSWSRIKYEKYDENSSQKVKISRELARGKWYNYIKLFLKSWPWSTCKLFEKKYSLLLSYKNYVLKINRLSGTENTIKWASMYWR